MNRETIYKYFNLIIKIIIGAYAFTFIIIKIKSGLSDNLFYIKTTKIDHLYIVLTLFLMFANWGIESYKWKYLVRKHVQISLFEAFKYVFSGITVSLITPNRIGEIPGRVFLLKKTDQRKNLIWLTTLGAFSQLIITVLIGTLGLYFAADFFTIYFSKYLVIILLGCVTILCIGFIFFQKLPKLLKKLPLFNKLSSPTFQNVSLIELINLLWLSGVRYSVFCIQYWLLLKAFGIDLVFFKELMLIPVCFFVASIIPSMLLSEIGVRSSVAVFVFGMVSDNLIAIIVASLLLWIINIAIPAFLGLFNLKQLTI